MTTLAQYDLARRALAEATRVDQVLPLRDEVEHIKLYARQIRDRALLADASVFQMRIERKLGTLLVAAEQAGVLQGRGRPKKPPASDPEKCPDEGHFPPVTFEELGLDRRDAAVAKKQAGIAEQAFETMVEAMRARVLAGRARIVDDAPIAGARAVMGSRAEPDDSLDYFPTPPWATRALLECVFPLINVEQIGAYSAWEPACGEGHIAEVLGEYFGKVIATDIHDYGYGDMADFLDPATDADADWIITNPPFGDKAEPFVLKALDRARYGVAMFVRLQWLETIGRYEAIYRDRPPTAIAFFAERVPLCKGRWNPDGDTATAYIWLVWDKFEQRQPPFWIPPGQRERLTRPDDIARFTTRPVTRRPRDLPPHDPETGEISEPEERPCATPVDSCAAATTASADADATTATSPPVGPTIPTTLPTTTDMANWSVADANLADVSSATAQATKRSPADDALDIPPFLRRPGTAA